MRGVQCLLAAGASARAADPWWAPLSLRGMAITRVSAIGDTITVRTGAGATLVSTDGGRTFAPAPAGTTLPPTGVTAVGTQRWEVDPAGRVLHQGGPSQGAATVDPGSPDLGRGAHLIAAPAALPGTVIAVSTDGTVWRRGQDGDWKEALLLLPASLIQGIPRVTSVTAFTAPLSDAVYLSTDGYAVLITTDGGDDWIRAGPGLPELRVLALGQLRAQRRLRGDVRRALGTRAPGTAGTTCLPGRGPGLAVDRDRCGHAGRRIRSAAWHGPAGTTSRRRLTRRAAGAASASVI